MRRILWLLSLSFLLCCCGCNEKEPDTIEVNSHDTVQWSGLTITFKRGDFVIGTVDLNTQEELTEYKKQVEFLLEQLEESERKMNVRTDVPVQSE